MDKQSEQGSEPEKKESNGQTPQTQQTEERAQHGSWQTRAQKENMEQKRGRDQLSPSQRSDSKAVALRGRTQQRKLTSHYEVSSSARLRRAARARQVLMKQSGSMAGTSSTADMVKSRGRFRRPGASSQRAEPRKLQHCQGASSCGPCTPRQPRPHPANPRHPTAGVP